MFDMSSRMLQRKLGEERVTFSEVINRWRLKQAMQFLQDPEIQIFETSERLHCSTNSHISRSFCRWTGTTPGQYREAAAGIAA